MDQIANAFVQAEVSAKTSVQAEYRRRELEYGYLQAQFFPELVHPNMRQRDEVDTYRLGARHAFSPSSILLASASYQERSQGFVDQGSDAGLLSTLDATQRSEGEGGELQHLLRSRYLDLVSGAGFFRIAGTEVDSVTLAFPPPPDGPGGTMSDTQNASVRTRHGNAYVYAHVRPIESLKVTVGASTDLLRNAVYGDRNQLNPKFGITWSPAVGTTLRASAFRVLRRTLLSDQTLEPTHVAGFNQFFDDHIGTRSWRYGVGADQGLFRTLFFGVEASRRDLEVPVKILSRTAAGIPQTSWHEYVARSYVNWTPRTWLAFRAEYAFERLDREPLGSVSGVTVGVHQANTHRVPLGLSVFNRSGLGVTATATYFNQKGSFGAPPFTDGSDRFWLIDAGLSWRLPQRAGTIGLFATNIFDKRFKLYENGGVSTWNSTVQPASAVIARVTLVAP
jgi:hypothetical protein